MQSLSGRGALHIIIDGYNLIRKVPALAQYEGRSLQSGREHLVARAAAYRGATGHRVTVVFDGPSASSSGHRGVIVAYAPSADDEVIRRAGPACLIVSSDREVADRARAKGADVMPSTEFWELASQHAGVAGPLRRGRRSASQPANPYPGGYDKDDDEDDEPRRKDKRGPSKRLTRSEREEDERRRRLRNLL